MCCRTSFSQRRRILPAPADCEASRSIPLFVTAVLILVTFLPGVARGQQEAGPEEIDPQDLAAEKSTVDAAIADAKAAAGFRSLEENASAVDPATVRFSFAGVPWRDVINWIAEEANLALHVDSIPSGSFTYSDPSTFTHQAAIDRINLFLLPQGYTLVRNGNLLSVINLSDPRSLQQLDALATLIRVEELDERASHDVVKCLFPLGPLEAEEAVEELSAIKLMMQHFGDEI